jgi:hypothetical protein
MQVVAVAVVVRSMAVNAGLMVLLSANYGATACHDAINYCCASATGCAVQRITLSQAFLFYLFYL